MRNSALEIFRPDTSTSLTQIPHKNSCQASHSQDIFLWQTFLCCYFKRKRNRWQNALFLYCFPSYYAIATPHCGCLEEFSLNECTCRPFSLYRLIRQSISVKRQSGWKHTRSLLCEGLPGLSPHYGLCLHRPLLHTCPCVSSKSLNRDECTQQGMMILRWCRWRLQWNKNSG